MVFWKKYHDSQLSSGYLVTHWPSYEIQPLELQFYHWLIQSIASHPTPNRINALLGVVNKWMKVRWSWWFVELTVVSKFVMIALSSRNDVRQWLCIQSKEYWAKDRTPRNPVLRLLLGRDPTVDAVRLESIRQIQWKPFKSLARYDSWYWWSFLGREKSGIHDLTVWLDGAGLEIYFGWSFSIHPQCCLFLQWIRHKLYCCLRHCSLQIWLE